MGATILLVDTMIREPARGPLETDSYMCCRTLVHGRTNNANSTSLIGAKARSISPAPVYIQNVSPKSWDSASSPAKDKEDYAHHQKQKEQDFRDSRRCRGDAAESKHGCHQRYN
jgi:hypothetical protein